MPATSHSNTNRRRSRVRNIRRVFTPLFFGMVTAASTLVMFLAKSAPLAAYHCDGISQEVILCAEAGRLWCFSVHYDANDVRLPRDTWIARLHEPTDWQQWSKSVGRWGFDSGKTTHEVLFTRRLPYVFQLSYKSVPIWLLFTPTAIAILWYVAQLGRKSRKQKHGLCPNCGYDLRASPNLCPECGTRRDKVIARTNA